MSKVYLVINNENAPGRVMAIFNDEGDANDFADALECNEEESYIVEARTLHYGQPSTLGYNN